jgi:hypothetical protein
MLLLIWDKAVRRLAIASLPALRLSARSIRRAWDGDDGAIAEVNLSRPEMLVDTSLFALLRPRAYLELPILAFPSKEIPDSKRASAGKRRVTRDTTIAYCVTMQ